MLRKAANWIVWHRHFHRLPRQVAAFYWRARRLAVRRGDRRTMEMSASPRQVSTILRHARGHENVVEIGTASAWSTIALALGNPTGHVWTYDPAPHEQIGTYLALAPEAEGRITFITGLGEEPRDEPSTVGALFIDNDHSHETTVAAFEAWRDRLAPDAVVIFHDYHPTWPGVLSAIEHLGLQGEVTENMFIWRAGPG